MSMTTGDITNNINLGPHQWVRVNTAETAFEPVTIEASKRIESYFSTTDGSGNYTVTYATAFSAVPNVQPQLQAPSNTQLVKITASSTTGFTINVQNRTDVVGLLPSYAAVSGASVGVLVVER
jgi:hypothetical protein